MPKQPSSSRPNQERRIDIQLHSPRQQTQAVVNSPANKKRNAATGSGAPIVKTGAYESIYDPTRLGDGGEISQSTGPVSEGDVSRADLAPGLGEAGGKVPFAQSARSYGQAAAKAAGQPGVPEDVRKMVSAYFNALIDESEG